jgi:hypothetical protein
MLHLGWLIWEQMKTCAEPEDTDNAVAHIAASFD